MLAQAQRLRRMKRIRYVVNTPARSLAELVDTDEFYNGVSITAHARTESVATSTTFSATVDAASGDSDVNAWKNAVITAGGSVSGDREDALVTLVGSLKTDGIWAKLDRFWIWSAENTFSALIDIKARVSASPVNSPTFTVDRGYAGNNSNSYINTNFDPSSNGVNYTRNSASGGYWEVNNTGAGSSDTQIGATAAGAYAVNIAANPGGNIVSRINQAAGVTVSNPGLGFIMANRSGSSASELYFNGASIGTNTGASAALIAQQIYVGARNNAGTADTFAPDQVAAVLFGASLDATEHANLNTRMTTFMTVTGVVEPDTDLAAWRNAVLAAGGTVSAARQLALRAFVLGLKTDGLWTKFDRLWIMAAENSQGAIIDLKARASVTVAGSPIFTANSGYATNATSIIETNYTPNVDAVQYGANAAHIAVWNNDNSGTYVGWPIITNSSYDLSIYPQYNDGLAYGRVNERFSAGVTAAVDRRGFYLANRSGFATNEFYRNGSAINSHTATSEGLPNTELLLYTWTGAAISIGGSFSSGEQALYYGHMRTLMTAIGVP